MECVFCGIVNKQIAAEIISEEKDFIVISDKYPEAPIHLLFIPKKHFEWSRDFSKPKLAIIAGLIAAAKTIADKQGISSAYKLVFNAGKAAHFSHIHLHLLGGWKNNIPKNNI